ncbi:MAG: hypothetical protein C7B47_04125 [Sulfobacillus thermosulfidooxidans]|uniref:Spore cortex biosynthesis protein YabQ n=1 Tax=Sulfobacillus thermosulfidooxidans TaxID=28034 RepID=A0A2T2X2Z0_SULTH|nr:MAG: hypothetical protein C7B47_04125 [Sulfobacillus thermosulfidooxidans]
MMSPEFTIAAWLLAGISLGLLSTIYGAMRTQWHIWNVIGHFLDWLWFVVAALLILVVYLWTDWGVFHAWSLLIIALGYGLWVWLAAPTTFGWISRILFVEARMVFYVTFPFRWFLRTLITPFHHMLRSAHQKILAPKKSLLRPRLIPPKCSAKTSCLFYNVKTMS